MTESNDEERIREAYAQARAEFTEADLQRYLQEEEGIPFETVIREIEEIAEGGSADARG